MNFIYKILNFFFLLEFSSETFATKRNYDFYQYFNRKKINISHQIEKEKRNLPDSRKNITILKTIQRKLNTNYLEKDFFYKLTRFTQVAREQKWPIDFHEICDLLKTIEDNKVQWHDDAKNENQMIRRTALIIDENNQEKIASFFISPKNQWFIHYKNSTLGSGAIKKAETIFTFHGSSDISKMRKLTLLKAKDKTLTKFIKEEIEIYEKIKLHSKNFFHGKKIPGIIQGMPFPLEENEYGILQETYDSELTIDMLTSNFGNSILKAIAEGLMHLHDIGFVHGDLKEGNILIKANYQADITDFGCTRAIDEDPFPRASASHEAPELLDDAFTPKSSEQIKKRDIFAWGIIALHALPPPFYIKTPFEHCKNYFKDYFQDTQHYKSCIQKYAPIFRETVEMFATNWCEQENCLWNIVAQTLHEDPDQRPNAKALYEQLSRI